MKYFLTKAITYIGYAVALYNICLRWFLMGSPLAKGLKVGYWGLDWADNEQKSRYIEVKEFERFGISGDAAVTLNFVLTYLHLITISALFLIFIVRAYQRLKNPSNYKSAGYNLTAVLGIIVILYIIVLHIV